MAVKVLVAHNNTQRLKQAVTDLHAAGFEVTATPDGGDAFARFFEEEPNIVICSSQLPSLAGTNIARMVRSQSPDTKMVLIFDPSDPEAAPDGVVRLTEPLDLQRLRDALPDIVFDAPLSASSEQTDLTSASPTRVFVHAVLKRFQRDNLALGALDDDGIGKLASIADNRNFSDGDLIIKQGQPGDSCYLLVEGQVRVTLEENNDKEVARINAGGFFGEMAMLSESKRTASVWAVGNVTLLWFERAGIMPFLGEHPRMREVLSGVALKRSEENLWRTLFDDEDVQRSLAQLDVAETDGETDDVSVDVDEAASAPTTPTAGEAGAQPNTVAFVAPASHTFADRLQALFHAHRFAFGALAGLCLGVLVGRGMPAAPDVSSQMAQHDSGAVEMKTPALPKPTPAVPSPTEPRTEPELADPGPAAPSSPAEPVVEAKPQAPAVVEKAPTAPEKVPATSVTVAVVSAAANPVYDGDRKKLEESYKAAEYPAAMRLAKKLDSQKALTDDGEFIFADLHRHTGLVDKAIVAYVAFFKAHPTHGRADDAQYWAAELYRQTGKVDEAKALYEKVAANEASNYRGAAVKKLAPK